MIKQKGEPASLDLVFDCASETALRHPLHLPSASLWKIGWRRFCLPFHTRPTHLRLRSLSTAFAPPFLSFLMLLLMCPSSEIILRQPDAILIPARTTPSSNVADSGIIHRLLCRSQPIHSRPIQSHVLRQFAQWLGLAICLTLPATTMRIVQD
jgi:hypothetical protein